MTEIKQLLQITKSLQKQYKGKLDFPLDIRLVGDIGEALVSERFDIEQYGKNAQVYDGHQRRIKKSSDQIQFQILFQLSI